jgi:hypothetical protein
MRSDANSVLFASWISQEIVENWSSNERCSTLTKGRDTKLAKSAMESAADFAVLQFACENDELWPIAVLLLDDQDRLHVRARPADELATKVPHEDVEVVALTLNQIAEDAKTGSGKKVLESLEDQLSNTIRISERQKTRVSNIQNGLKNLYDKHVTSWE